MNNWHDELKQRVELHLAIRPKERFEVDPAIVMQALQEIEWLKESVRMLEEADDYDRGD